MAEKLLYCIQEREELSMIENLNIMNRAVADFFNGLVGTHAGIYLSVAFSFIVGVLLVWALLMPLWCVWKIVWKEEEYEDEEEQ